MYSGISRAGVSRPSVSRAALLGAVALVASLLAPGAAQAQLNTTLNTLLPGGSNAGGITVGDKRYSEFTFSSTGSNPVPAGGVNVSLTEDGNRHNLRFTFVQDALASTAGQRTDAVICYRVDVLGSQQINGVGLAFDSSVGTGAGFEAASVSETISRVAPNATDVGLITVFNDGAGGLPDNTTMTLPVSPTASTLFFCKDIIVSSRPEGGRVVISTVDNFVTQVPEPGTIALVAAAGGALLLRRRRA